MSKRDYEAIARILWKYKADRKIILAFAALFSSRSSSFNYQKFIQACGL